MYIFMEKRGKNIPELSLLSLRIWSSAELGKKYPRIIRYPFESGAVQSYGDMTDLIS